MVCLCGRRVDGSDIMYFNCFVIKFRFLETFEIDSMIIIAFNVVIHRQMNSLMILLRGFAINSFSLNCEENHLKVWSLDVILFIIIIIILVNIFRLELIIRNLID